MGSRKLTIEILGDSKGAAGAFGDAAKSADGFGKKLGGAAKVAGVAMLGIAGGALAMVPGILDTGMSLDALAKKAEVVFGDSLGMVKDWAKENAAAMGLTQSEATGAAASLADLLKPMGFTSEAAAGMSTKMLDLSGALSAWSGGTKSATEVSDIMTKAMLGETDGLKALGISISAADVSARLALKGQKDLTGAAREQAEALAVQELIMEKSTDAQDAWASGAMDGVKAQNEQKASLSQLKESLVKAVYPALKAIVPVVTEVAKWLGENLPVAIGIVVPIFKQIGEVAVTAFDAVSGAVGWLIDNEPVLGAIAAVVGVGLVVALTAWTVATWAQVTALWAQATAFAAAYAPIIAIAAAIAALVAGVIWAYQNWGWFRDAVDAVASFLTDTLWPALVDIGGVIANVVSVAVDGLTTAVTTVWGWLQTLWDKSEGLRSFYAAAFKLGFEVVSTAIGLYISAVQTVWGWLQTLWDRSEGIRGFLAGVFSAGFNTASTAVGYVTSAVSAAWSVMKDLWDRTEGIRSFLVGSFQAGLSVAASAFGAISRAVEKVWEWTEGLRSFLVGAFQSGMSAAKAVWDGLYNVLTNIWNMLKNIINAAGNAIGKLADIGSSFPGMSLIPGFASGTSFAPGGLAVVGEDGPELMNVPRGSQILSHPDSVAAVAAMSAGASYGRGGLTIVQNFNGAVVTHKDLIRSLYDGIVEGQRRGELVGSIA